MSEIIFGKVSDLNDPDGLGRIEVEIQGYSESTKIGWVRVITPAGGDKQGWVWLPNKDEEVVLLKAGDSANHMIVLGAVYNGTWKPEKTATDKGLDTRLMRTPTGHLLEFFDGKDKGKGSISIVTADETLKIVLDEAAKAITIEGTKKLDIQFPDGTVNVECKEAVVKCSANATVEAKEVTIKGSTKCTVVVGGNKVEVASAGVTIKGSMVKIN